MTVQLTGNFLATARCLIFEDGNAITWTFNPNTNQLTAAYTGAGSVGSHNPTANVGLSAVNGTATTWMTSDSAPALSQAIVPTWTGVHTFSAEPVLNAGAQVANAQPLQWKDNGGTVRSVLQLYSDNNIYFDNPTTTGTINLRVNGAGTTGMTVNANGSLGAISCPLTSAATRVSTGLANFKSALSTSSSNALAADAALTVTCNETGWYDVEAFLVFFEATLGTGGFQFDFNAGGSTIANSVFAVNGFVTASIANAAITSISTATGFGTVVTSSAAPSWVRVKGTIQVTGTGTFGIRWAQNTTLGADPTTLTAGSSITLTKIG